VGVRPPRKDATTHALSIRDLLPAAALAAIERALAKPLSYGARFLVMPGEKPRALVILGETHLKLGSAAELGKEVVRRFDVRGVETFQRDRIFGGRLLGHVIMLPRALLRAASLGTVRDSTITEAKALKHGTTVEIEKGAKVPLSLHVASVYLIGFFVVGYATPILLAFGGRSPALRAITRAFQRHTLAAIPAYLLRRKSWAWMLYPALAILTARDEIMAEGIARLFRETSQDDAVVVVVGRAHLPGLARELVEKYGFLAAEL
jgi:hypothetical protein